MFQKAGIHCVGAAKTEHPGGPEGVVCAQAEGGVLAILGSAGAACLVCGLGAARVVATAARGGLKSPKLGA